MYIRIARFENAEGNWDERVQDIKNRMRTPAEGSPMAQARAAVKRAMMLVDRENGRGASLIFVESKDDLRRVDEAMSQMTPLDGGGTRASVEMYEIAVDEQTS